MLDDALPPATAYRGDYMALTPEDVLNKNFTPTQFRRGYDEREVDDFLDEVVAEMRRLAKESDDLRTALNECREGRGLEPLEKPDPESEAKAAKVRAAEQQAAAEAEEAEQRVVAAGSSQDERLAEATSESDNRLAKLTADAEQAERAAQERIAKAQAEAEQAEAEAAARLEAARQGQADGGGDA